MSLRDYIDSHVQEKVLTHIDAVPDNFLFTEETSGKEDIRLIDWEYAGMQDPHVDIAMFCIYALYNKRQVDRLINIYFENKCDKETRLKYIATLQLVDCFGVIGVNIKEILVWNSVNIHYANIDSLKITISF